MLADAPPRRPTTIGAAVVVLLTIGTLGVAVPAGTEAATKKAAKRCPSAGHTLAFERYGRTVTSRVWRLNGRTYGCTLVGSTRPRTHLLSRSRTNLLRLDDDTVAWTTTHVAGDGVPFARVWAFDLTSGGHFLRSALAVPRSFFGDVQREGTVQQLRISSDSFVGWIANGNTVVVGADDPGDLTVTGPDGGSVPLYVDAAGMAVAGRYEARPELPSLLSDSFAIGSVPGDHGDSDDCAYSYATAYTWSTGPGQRFEARMRGTRITPTTCG